MTRSGWKTEGEWTQFGLDNGYDERNPKSLSKSEKSEERSWMFKGRKQKWVKNFDFDRKEKPKGYWRDWDNVERELREIIEENGGDFPTQTILNNIGRKIIAFSIYKYHGGTNSVREKMGYKINIKSKDYWEDWDNVERELREVIEENGGDFPNNNRLREMSKSSLSSAITKHGGVNVVRERMGYISSKKPKGYWQDWSNVEKELREVIEENGGDFPNQTKLSKMGKSSLVVAITKHGGVNVVRERMGFVEEPEHVMLEGIIDSYVGGNY